MRRASVCIRVMVISDFTVLRRIIKPVKIYNLYFFKPSKGFSLDSRSIREGQVFIALKGKYKDGHNFIQEAVKKGASLVIAQRDIPYKPKVPFFLVNDSYETLKRIVAYIRRKKKLFVYGITGSVGKTTVKEMLSFLLEGDFTVLKNYHTENNLLGVAKTMFSLNREKVAIFELGSSRSGEIQTLAEIIYPDAGLITCIKPVHLEGFGSLNEVFKEKSALFRVNPKMQAVLNKEDSYLRRIDFLKRIYWYGRRKDCFIYARRIRRNNRESVFLIQDKFRLVLPIQFEIFILNALCAISGACLLHLPLKGLVEKMNNFRDFPPGRMQIKEKGEITVLNDSYNANPYSFKEAVKVVRRYPLRKVAVIGDMLELGKKSIYYHQLLAQDVIKSNFEYVLIKGKYTLHLKKKLQELGYNKVFHFSSHRHIAEFINRRFLSPKQAAGKQKSRCLIFLKGSRKMKLEKVVKLLTI